MQSLQGSGPISYLSKYSTVGTSAKLAAAPGWDYFLWGTASTLMFGD